MSNPKTPEEKKDAIFAEIEDRIHKEFTSVGNKWISGINNVLTILALNIGLDKEEGNRLDAQLREAEQYAKESLADFGNEELPPENSRHELIQKIVDLQY